MEPHNHDARCNSRGGLLKTSRLCHQCPLSSKYASLCNFRISCPWKFSNASWKSCPP